MAEQQAASDREIFQQAVALPPEDRAAYLDKACGENAELRREVESLLEAHGQVSDFMEQPAVDRSIDSNVLTAGYEPLSERLGSVIGPYKLMEQIGEGGFGLVFVAEQQRPVRRKVALKIIKPGMDTRSVIARFEAERQALALMDHPNIAKVFDAGTTDSGRPYFVMELVRGVPITEFCDQRHLTPRGRLELFVPLCHAIQHAHQKGIIHRDVKPTNVLVTLHDGVPVVKVIDFGVAKALSQQLTDRTIYTQFAEMIGTPLYMSPEQAEMSGLDIDTRSDIYSLGVLLYELLTGTTPFDRQQLKQAAVDEIRRIIREEEPPKPSTRISQSGDRLPSIAALRGTEPARLSKLIQGDLDWIVMKCLEKERARRYESASAVARDVERYLHDEAVEASPPSIAYRFRKFARRHRAAIAAATAIAVLLVTGVAVSSWLAIRASQAEAQAKANEQNALSERDAKERARRDAVASAQQARDAAESERRAKATAERNLYVARMNLVNKAIDSGNRIAAERLLAHYGPETALAHLRGFEWFYWQDVCRTVQRESQLSAAMAVKMAVSGDGSQAAVAVFQPPAPMVVKMLNVETGEFNQREVEVLNTNVRCLAISPDASKVAVGCDPGVMTVWNLTGAEPPRNFNLSGAIWDAAFSGDGRFLAVAVDDGTLLSDADTGNLVLKLLDARSGPLSVGFSSDGKLLAVGYFDGTISFWRVKHGTKLGTIKAHAGPVRSIRFVPETPQLVTSGDDRRVRLWDDHQARAPKREFATGNMASISISPDGTTLLCGDLEGQVRAFDLKSGNELLRLRPGNGAVYGIACLPGELFVTASVRMVEKWRIRRAGARRVLDVAEVSDISFSPDGQTIATYVSGAWRFWSVATLEETQMIKLQGPAPGMLLPQSGRLAVRRYKSASHDQGASNIFDFVDTPATMPMNAGFDEGAVEILDTRTGSRLRSIELPRGMHGIDSVAPNEQQLVLAARSEKTLLIVDLEPKEQVRTLEADRNYIDHTCYSPRGHLLATAGTDGLKLWDTSTWTQIDALKDDSAPAQHVRFSPDGKILAAGQHSLIKLYDAQGYQLIAVLDGHSDKINSLSFSPDGKTLASGSFDNTMKLWDIETREEKATFTFPDWASSVQFSPDGQSLAVRCDGKVTLFYGELANSGDGSKGAKQTD
jgi:WD40 repeat protein/serine/threonine protein kinase